MREVKKYVAWRKHLEDLSRRFDIYMDNLVKGMPYTKELGEREYLILVLWLLAWVLDMLS